VPSDAAATAAALVATFADLQGRALFEALAERLCDPALAHWFLREALAGFAGAPHVQPALQVHQGESLASLVVHQDQRVHLAITLVDAGADAAAPARLRFGDGWTRLHVLAGAAAEASSWRLADTPGGLVCALGPRVALHPGMRIDFDNASETLHIRAAGRPETLLRLIVRDPEPGPARVFETATGRLVGAAQPRLADGRAVMQLRLLQAIGDAAIAGRVASLLDAWPPALRWEGLRTIIALDPARGLDILRGWSGASGRGIDPELGAIAAEALAMIEPCLA